METPPKWLTTRDLCLRYGVDRSTIHRWIKAGRLPKPDTSLSSRPRWPTALLDRVDARREGAITGTFSLDTARGAAV